MKRTRRAGETAARRLAKLGRILTLLCLPLAFAPTTGCGKPASQNKPVKKASAAGQAEKLDARRLPGRVVGAGWHIPWRVRDPKHPNGPGLPVLIADAETGEILNSDANPTVQLGNARVKLFRNGLPTADVDAPQLTANQHDRIVIGTGGVRVNSLADPPDTVVTADKITWDTRTNVIVAVGNARVVRTPKAGGAALSQSGGRITFDTALKEFVVE